ncbi:MAG: hypothetical protein AABX47_10565 [Nanoarchaeota archaeon]
MALDDHADLGTFFLRIGTGLYFLWVGITLLVRPDLQAVFAGVLSKTPLVFLGGVGQTVMVMYTLYLLLGALLLLGLFTRLSGFVIAVLAIINMAVINWQMTIDVVGLLGLLNMAKDILLLTIGASLFFTGAKMYAVDCIMVD